MPKVKPGDGWKHVNFYHLRDMLQEKIRNSGEGKNFSTVVRDLVADYLGVDRVLVTQGRIRSGMGE